MTDNTSSPRSTNRWYSILGFQFSRQQAIRGAIMLALGAVAVGVVFRAWYLPPRAVSRLIRSVGGSVQYAPDRVPNAIVPRLIYRQTRLFGLTATDEEIEWVQLSESNVKDDWLHHLKPIEGLKTLHLHERQLGPGLAELGSLPELSNVSIWQLCTGDLSHLQQLPNLTGVSLIGATCTDIDLNKLTRLPRLSWLEVSSTPLTNLQLKQISQIKTLHFLNISRARMDAAALKGIGQLAEMPSLQHFCINGVTDDVAAVLAKFQSLTYLMIDGADLSDDGAAALAKLSKLHDLQLQQCVRPLDIETLRRQMPHCRINYNVRTSATR